MGPVQIEIELLVALATVITALVWWCFRLEARQKEIISTLGDMRDAIDTMQVDSHAEHKALLDAMQEIGKQQATEHKEMIITMQGIKEPLIEAVAVLKSHVDEERKK